VTVLVTVPVLLVGVPVLLGLLEVGVGCETVGVMAGVVVTVVVLFVSTVDTGSGLLVPPPPQADSAALANSMVAKVAYLQLDAMLRCADRNNDKNMI
jgi:hypothetical protein